ncbi:hypothetical protein F5Y03DRAFT_163513 [Xylaria venustula]|nr:hypothetical protein F5Y03DRAFT_163513 [Xylaria venustula]
MTMAPIGWQSWLATRPAGAASMCMSKITAVEYHQGQNLQRWSLWRGSPCTPHDCPTLFSDCTSPPRLACLYLLSRGYTTCEYRWA